MGFWTKNCSFQLEYILGNGSENLPARGVVDTITNLRTKTTTLLHLLTFCDWSAHTGSSGRLAVGWTEAYRNGVFGFDRHDATLRLRSANQAQFVCRNCAGIFSFSYKSIVCQCRSNADARR